MDESKIMGMDINLPIGGRHNLRRMFAMMRQCAERRGVKLINGRRRRQVIDGQEILSIDFEKVAA